MTLMARLGPKASAIVEAGRAGLRGSDADLERVEAALRARLGPNALPPDVASLVPRSGASGIGWRFVAPAVGVCVIGGALFFGLRPAQNRVAERKPADLEQPVATAPEPSAVITTSPSAELVNTSQKPTEGLAPSARSAGPSTSSTAVRPERDQLVLEVALLSRATTALNGGRIGEALKALDEHQRQFPNGVLSEERRAAKAQALCSSDRIAEGRAQLARISAQAPAGKRAKQVCDSASTAAPGVKAD
ncbi:MAG TPA: hypothetical protein VJV79_30425 [Polyangiaceae bacterium]|nr:hypothetical protein [Polyangiaceae bacterium]